MTPKGLFASLFFGVLDLGRGVLEFVNAGHDHPFLVRRDGVTCATSTTGARCSGLMEGSRYERARAELDRATSSCSSATASPTARTQDGELFGVDRLKDAAIEKRGRAARLALYSLLGEVQGFSAGSPPRTT